MLHRIAMTFACAAVLAGGCLMPAATAAAPPMSYVDIADSCGQGPNDPVYTQEEYVAALAEATKAARKAEKSKNAAQLGSITKKILKMQECQREDKFRIAMPPVTDCKSFISGLKSAGAAFASATQAAAGDSSRQTKLAENYAKVVERFRQPAKDCFRTITRKCVDLTKTSEVDELIALIKAMDSFGFLHSINEFSGILRWMAEKDPVNSRIRPCAPTDYKCSGADTEACKNRERDIKIILDLFANRNLNL
jgi:hypothetical protein